MEVKGWELNIDLLESIMIGFQREVFEEQDVVEVDWSIVFMFARLRLTLIYN